MDFSHFTAGKDDSERRLDKIIRKFLPENALSGLYRSIRTGLIRVNNKKTKPEYKVSSGDDISIATFLINKGKEESADCNISLPPVLFRNEHILVLNKPYDVLVQPSSESKKGTTLSELVAEEYKNSEINKSLSFTPGPLHRLDRKTTGVLFFSQSIEGAHWFADAIKNHLITKKYIAIVCGKVSRKEKWIDYISKNEETINLFHTVSVFSEKEAENQKNETNSVQAITTVYPLSYGSYNSKPISLVGFLIETGRTHQIRSQSSFHGHPLLGDDVYGGGTINEDQSFYLHSYETNIPNDNPIGLPESIKAFISTKFEKMLTKSLINWDGLFIV